MTQSSDTFLVTGRANQQILSDDILVTPTGGAQGRLADKIAGGAGIAINDGTTTVSGVTSITIVGGFAQRHDHRRGNADNRRVPGPRSFDSPNIRPWRR